MSNQIGKLLTCDRCGKTEFLPYIGTREFDGGYTRTNEFQEPAEAWSIAEDLGDCTSGHEYVELCPSCRRAYLKTKKDFFLMGGAFKK